MFQYAPHVNAKTKKRSQKENRRKAKRRKVSRKAANIQRVREFISNASASEVIQIQNLKLEALSTLSLCQVKYLQLMHEDWQLSTEAVNLISEYVDNFPRKENTNLEPDNAHDDDSNNDDDDDDDDDDDKYNNDIDDDADKAILIGCICWWHPDAAFNIFAGNTFAYFLMPPPRPPLKPCIKNGGPTPICTSPHLPINNDQSVKAGWIY